MLCAAALLALGFSVDASALSIPFFDNFNTITSTQLNTPPAGWSQLDGTVDSIKNGHYGITCFGNTGGCVDLDGSTFQAGYLLTSGAFSLVAGQTYRLSAEVSGNQRGAVADILELGFFNSSDLVLASKTIKGIASGSPFSLYSVLFTPSARVTATVFFDDVLGNNNQGPILDNVKVAAVPLPPAAWLMLSGLAALGAIAPRRISASTA
jgi:hypothetical protein